MNIHRTILHSHTWTFWMIVLSLWFDNLSEWHWMISFPYCFSTEQPTISMWKSLTAILDYVFFYLIILYNKYFKSNIYKIYIINYFSIHQCNIIPHSSLLIQMLRDKSTCKSSHLPYVFAINPSDIKDIYQLIFTAEPTKWSNKKKGSIHTTYYLIVLLQAMSYVLNCILF